MDAIPPVTETDKQADLRRLEAALAADRLDPRPSIPNEVMQARLLKRMAELKAKIASRAA